MNFQAQSVSGAMEESLHSPLAFAGFVALAGKKLLDGLVNPRRDDAGAHQLKGGLLSAMHRVVQFADRLAGASLDHRPGDVAEITGFLRAGENVEDDRFV